MLILKKNCEKKLRQEIHICLSFYAIKVRRSEIEREIEIEIEIIMPQITTEGLSINGTISKCIKGALFHLWPYINLYKLRS